MFFKIEYIYLQGKVCDITVTNQILRLFLLKFKTTFYVSYPYQFFKSGRYLDSNFRSSQRQVGRN